MHQRHTNNIYFLDNEVMASIVATSVPSRLQRDTLGAVEPEAQRL